MTESEHTDENVKDDGTISSPKGSTPSHEWTEDEMRKAKPYPLPTVPEKTSGVQKKPGAGKMGTSKDDSCD
jgi:hypothetical protein